MLNLLKTSAVAAVVATAPIAASAVTVVADGDVVTVVAGELYLSSGIESEGGAGEWSAKFSYPAANEFDSLPAVASSTIGAGTLSSFSGLTMAWHEVDGMMSVGMEIDSAAIAAGTTTLSTVFADPNFDQYLVVTWTDSIGTPERPVDFDLEVQVAAVPVPAAGLMLLTALGGAAALRRRK